MTTIKQISKIYYRNLFKHAIFSNFIFMLMIVGVNFLVDKEIIPSTPIQFAKSFAVYFGMVVVMTLISYYLNRFRSITLESDEYIPFVKKQLDFLYYAHKENDGSIERYEATKNQFIHAGGDMYILNNNNQIQIAGPIKTVNLIKDRLEEKYKKEVLVN